MAELLEKRIRNNKEKISRTVETDEGTTENDLEEDLR
jgi:hypothetical protein